MQSVRSPNYKNKKNIVLASPNSNNKEIKIMEKKRFDEFKNEIVSKIQAYLPEKFKDCEVSLQLVHKNNNLNLTGLVIRSNENNIAPTIYLEQFFQRYEDGADMDEILKAIAELRVTHELEDCFDIKQITEWERCKDRIVPRIVGTEDNCNLLNERPHKLIADLAVTYHILLEQSTDEGSMSIPITNQLMYSWKIDSDELHDVALRNMNTLLPTSFRGMSEVISEMMGISSEELSTMGMPSEDEQMYVLTNKLKMNGAAALLDTKIMGEIVEILGDIYILPSSIHEVLVIPAKTGMETSALVSMVCEVNSTQVSPEERLSNHVYKYTIKDGLFIAE